MLRGQFSGYQEGHEKQDIKALLIPHSEFISKAKLDEIRKTVEHGNSRGLLICDIKNPLHSEVIIVYMMEK